MDGEIALWVASLVVKDWVLLLSALRALESEHDDRVLTDPVAKLLAGKKVRRRMCCADQSSEFVK